MDQFLRWENEPFLKIVTFLQAQPFEAPFIADRIAALKLYGDSDQYSGLLHRKPAPAKHVAIIDEIELIGLADPAKGIYPYVRCSLGQAPTFRTPTYKWGTTARWKNIADVVTTTNGQSIFFEIFDDGYYRDTLVGGFVIYPMASDAKAAEDGMLGVAKYTTDILWNWKDRSSLTRVGHAHVKIRFSGTEK